MKQNGFGSMNNNRPWNKISHASASLKIIGTGAKAKSLMSSTLFVGKIIAR
jgi:hypothetical protein